MALTSQTATYTNTADGISVAFTFPFYILDGSHIAVTLTALDGSLTSCSYVAGSSLPGGASASSYIVTGITTAGFTVTFPNATLLASGVKVTADRATPLTQPSSWTSNDTFPSTALEKALDRVTMEMQTVKLSVSRCLSSSNPNLTYTFPTPTALGFFQWNAAGTAIQYQTISQIGLGFLASTTSAASIRIPHGVGPTAPTNGDIWSTTAGLFARINGATVGPFIQSSGAPVQSVAGRSGTVTLTAADIGAGTFGGKVSAQASTTGGAGFALPHGVGPTAPVDGDVWTTSSGLFARINGTTVGPLGAGGGSFSGGTLTSNLTTVAASASASGFTLTPGVAPTTPTNGDLWVTTAALFARINGVTQTVATLAGGTFTGTIVAPAATTALASIRLPHGAAPSAPTNGDLWSTTAALFARMNGATKTLAFLEGATFTGTVALKNVTEATTTNATASGALTVDLSLGTLWNWTLTGNVTGITIANPTNCTAFTLRIAQDATGGRTVAWSFSGATVRWAGGIAPTQTSTASKADYYTFVSADGGTSFDAFVGGQNF